MTNGDEITAEAQATRADYNPRLIAAALACVWFAVLGVMAAMGLILILQSAHSASTVVAAPVMVLLFLVQVPAAVGVLVLSILGGMWRAWIDGVMSAALLLSMMAVDLILWPLIESQPGVGFTSCSQDGCTFGSSTTDLWIGVGVQTLLLAILLVVTAHWLWRLRPQTGAQKVNRLVIAGIALVCAGILAAVDANISTHTATMSITGSGMFSGGSASSSSGPSDLTAAGPVNLINDLGKTVRVVYCPGQNCSGQSARTLAAGAQATFTAKGGSMTDSFVVLGARSRPICGLADSTMGSMPLSSADTETCGMDVATLTVPH
ncbi:MAG: hypothetical protein ACTHJM_01970 [Marmoricola sp.]